MPLQTVNIASQHRCVHRVQAKIKELGLPADQKAIALMDCWSVHKSKEFRTWWKAKYPWLLFLFIPAGAMLAGLVKVGLNALQLAIHLRRPAAQKTF